MNNPYINYAGVRHRFPYDWHGGAGGVLPNARAADTRALGAADLYESGYDDPNWPGYYQLQEFMLGVGAVERPMATGGFLSTALKPIFDMLKPHTPQQGGAARTPQQQATGDYPAFRLDGPEPIDPMPVSGIPIWDGLSDNEKLLAVAAAGAGVYWLWKRSKRRGRR